MTWVSWQVIHRDQEASLAGRKRWASFALMVMSLLLWVAMAVEPSEPDLAASLAAKGAAERIDFLHLLLAGSTGQGDRAQQYSDALAVSQALIQRGITEKKVAHAFLAAALEPDTRDAMRAVVDAGLDLEAGFALLQGVPPDLLGQLLWAEYWSTRVARVEAVLDNDPPREERRRLLTMVSCVRELRRLDVTDRDVLADYLAAATSSDTALQARALKHARAAASPADLPPLGAFAEPEPVHADEESRPPPAVAVEEVPASPLPAPVDLPVEHLAGLPLERVGALVEGRLDNGMAVTLVGDPALRHVSVVHRVDVGAATEPGGLPGSAHLVEHLMFRGTDAYPVGAWDQFIDASGGSANAFTTHDDTTYVSTVPAEHVAELLDLEADRFQHFRVRDDVLDVERSVVADERRWRVASAPSAEVELALHQELLGEHPYARDVGATPPGDVEALQAFFDEAYQPGNRHLVITGPFEPRALLDEVEARYRSEGGGVVPKAPEVSLTQKSVKIRAPGRPGREVGLVWKLPPGVPCIEGSADGPCTSSYWEDQVAIALFTTAGVNELERRLSYATMTPADIAVYTWQGASGGYLVVTARRRSGLGVALHNVAGATVSGLAALFNMGVDYPYRSNPTPRMLRGLVAGDEAHWLHASAIQGAKDEVVRHELSRLWSAEARATAQAHKAGLGLPADDNAALSISQLESLVVRARFHEIFGEEQAVVRIR